MRRQHYRTSRMMVHFCHVACSVDCFRDRLGLGRESGLGAFKCVMLCGYFEEKYLSWRNALIQNGRRNNRLGKRNNEISLYAYDGMNILVGATVRGGGVVLGQLSGGGGRLSLVGNFQGGCNCLGGNHPGGSCPGGDCLGSTCPGNLLAELSFVILTIHLCNGLNYKNFVKPRKTCFLTV